jgi:hypothetical protein
MNIIKHFCKNAQRLSVNTSNVKSLESEVVAINIESDTIKRHRLDSEFNCLFNMELNLSQDISLSKQIEHMKTIELFYPHLFNWRFNGENIECFALIPMKQEYLGIFSRYRGVNNFIIQLRERLLSIIRYRGYENVQLNKQVDYMLFSNGSINYRTDLYVVEIEPHMTEEQILTISKNRLIIEKPLYELDMKFWIKEINPDIRRKILPKSGNKIPLTDDVYDMYPPCIKAICNLKKKGNYNRFLLATFFLVIHNQTDAKHQLYSVLSDEEREHIETGNCKDQWRAILNGKYSGPSCKKMIEAGFCQEDCGNPYPHYVKKEEKNE